MKKRNYSRQQLFLVCVISIAFLAAAIILNRIYPPKSEETVASPVAAASVRWSAGQTMVRGQALEAAGELAEAGVVLTPELIADPTDGIASYLQGPKSWKARREWSGKWGKTMYDGGNFGAFGCGLCCMANIYCSLTKYRCSPVDVYEYAKKNTEYGGGGAIDWGYMKETMEALGFTCKVGKKPADYETFQKIIGESEACIVVVSSSDSTCYWKDTPGHYVTLFLYDESSDKVYLTDSGDPDHNRHWVSLDKVYRSLKTANARQYMTVKAYDEVRDQWKHADIGGVCVLPEGW